MRKTIILTAAAVAALTACHDYRNDFMVEDSVYLRSADESLVEEFTVYDATNRIGVIKAGRGSEDCTVELGVDNDLVGDYNYERGTDFVPLPKAFYNRDEIEGKKVTIGKDDVRAKVDITWDSRELVLEMNATPDKYVIPVYIKSASIDIQEEKRLVLVRPILSTASVRDVNNPVTCRENSMATVKVGVTLSSAIKTKDVTLNLSFAPAELTDSKGNVFTSAPSGSIKLVKESVTIPAGDVEADVEVELDMAGVPDGTDRIGGTVTITGCEVKKTSNVDKARSDDDGTVITYMPVKTPVMNILATKTKAH